MKPLKIPIQPTLDLGFDTSEPGTGKYLMFPEARELRKYLLGLENGGVVGLYAKPGAGASSIVQSALATEKGKVFIYTCVKEETSTKALLGLYLSLCPTFKRAPHANEPRRTTVENIGKELIGQQVGILVLEHLELEEVDFGRYVVAIRDYVLAQGGNIRIVVQYSRVARKGRLVIAPELAAAYTHTLEIGDPGPMRTISVLAFHLTQKADLQVLIKKRDNVALNACKMVYDLTQGDLRRTAALANKMNYFFGDRTLGLRYFQLLQEFLLPS
jgi:hypothetical protein